MQIKNATTFKTCVLEIPVPQPHLPYLEQVKNIASQLEKLHTLLDGEGWLWVRDFIWQPVPNWNLASEYERRYSYKRELGIGHNRQDGSLYNLEADKYGGIAEDYVARLLGCSSDRQLYKGGDGKFDFIFNGKKVDVKWLSWEGANPFLKINLGNNQADLYVVTQGKKINILGWVTKEQVASADLIDWGYGHHLSIPAKDFNHFDKLIAESTSLKPGEYCLYPEHISLVIRRSKFYLQKIEQPMGAYTIFRIGKNPVKDTDIVPYSINDCWDLSQANHKENIHSWEQLSNL